MSQDEDCQICFNKYTKILRKPVECQYCKYSSCLECAKKYVLSIITDPKCMKCNVAWNREFIDSNFAPTFRNNELKKHRENILLDREKSLLPATVELAQVAKEARTIKQNINNLYEKRTEIQRELSIINKDIRDLQYNNNNNRFQNNADIPGTSAGTERKQFMRACIMSNCRGFLSSQWKCGICNVQVCPDCHELKKSIKDDEHVCNPDDIASAKLLAKDSKPCPKCASLIFKIDGCNQMWCIMCHTAFDWVTGKETKSGTIHNPEYYRYIREKNGGNIPRNLDDIQVRCGGMPAYWEVNRYIEKNKKILDTRYDNLVRLHRVILHISDVEIPRYPNNNILTNYQDLRIAYLLNEIDENEWKYELQKKEKKIELITARRNVYEMIVTIATDLFYKLIITKIPSEIINILDEFEEAIKYYNESIDNVAKRFSSTSIRKFNDIWELV